MTEGILPAPALGRHALQYCGTHRRPDCRDELVFVATREKEGEARADSRRHPDWIGWGIEACAVVIPIGVLILAGYVGHGRSKLSVSGETGSGEFLVPVAVVCCVAMWHWIQEVKAGSRFGRARPFAAVSCGLIAFVCVLTQGMIDLAPKITYAGAIATITYVAMSIAAAGGTIGVMATSGREETK